MKAIRLDGPVSVEDLVVHEVAKPELTAGHALVKVKAFGVNESEVTSRKGESDGDFSFPRILGIEGVGVIEEVNADSTFEVGQKVATMMGGLGRGIDGSYADYMLVSEENLIPLETDMPWDIVGALPEMLQTAYGSLNKGLNLESGDVLFIRGGSSTVGLMAASLAKSMGATVISTTRNPDKLDLLKDYGVDYPVLDNADLAESVKAIAPNGVDKALELVGMTAIFDTMTLVKTGGKVCFTGALAGGWSVENFSPFMIPFGVFMTSYAGGARDLPAHVFNHVLDLVAKGELKVPIAQVYQGLEAVGQAQENLESGRFIGKHVVVLPE